MEKELQDKARAEILAKMKAAPFAELEKKWMSALNSLYGLDRLTNQADWLGAKDLEKAIYRSFSRCTIIFFEEFLKMDDERRAKK